MELLTIKHAREACTTKTRDADIKIKELERLKIALEQKCSGEIEDYRKRYERERDDERRTFD